MSSWHLLRSVLALLAGGSRERPLRGCCAPNSRRVVLEALEDRRLLSVVQADGALYDFGDAPASYATTLAADGARHVATGPMLGSVRDAEADGVPSLDADNDDTSGMADEDGVTFGSIQAGQTDASVTVNVQNAPAGAKLDAWIDFNGDGSWGGAGERIAHSVAVVNGDNLIEFDVPSWAASGETYGRFRLSTTGNVAPRGEVADGEVEDCLLSIIPSKAANGIFVTEQELSPARGANSVFAADLDGDGDLDVLSASTYDIDARIAWYENIGGGAFGPQQVITRNERHAGSVSAADLDGDGDQDVLCTIYSDYRITWFENNGDGIFGSEQAITSEARYADPVFAADVDGDGDQDVLCVSRYGGDEKIVWYENGGTGEFGDQQVVTTDVGNARSVFASDLDGDDDLDVLSASALDDKIAWYENYGGGVFGSQQVITTAADFASCVMSADLDGDGDQDVLSASEYDDKIAWYENTGSGAFGSQQIITTNADGARSVSAADVDGDGDQDVLSASWYDDKIAWYENQGAGRIGSQQIITMEAPGAMSVCAPDLDGDGDPDVLSAALLHHNIAWYENSGEGTFGNQQLITTDVVGIESEIAADLDGDGDLDVLAAVHYDDKIVWHENTGGGAFGNQQLITSDVDGPSSVFTADLDGDGDLDVLSASLNDDKIAWYENEGMGTFGSQQIITTAAYGARSVFAADLDGDGDQDVLSASYIDDKIAWYENNGGGAFGPQQIITTAADGATCVFAADLDGDGDLDVLSPGRLAWYENNGTGDFGTQHLIVTYNYDSVLAADLDGDGDMDVLSSFSTYVIDWYENTGDGAFGSAQIITRKASGGSTSSGDLDGDGDLDVLSASRYHGKIAWFENNGGAFGPQQVITNDADRASSVVAADLDRDGDLDILPGVLSDEEIVWFENVDYVDFGDAPDTGAGTGAGNYNTLASDNGPRHAVVAGLFMGATVDADDGALQNGAASADDLDQLPDDEDGLSDPAGDLALTLGTRPSIDVTVTNTSGRVATLSGWIDYNHDGVFDNATERAQAIVANGTVSGIIALTFPWLVSEYTGDTFARFRFSTDEAAANPTGRARDGEVEDYQATISGVPGIDLLGMGFDAAPDNLLESGGTATVEFLLRNFGDTAAGPFDVQFYLSDDAIIDPATDILLNLAASDTSYDALEPEAYHVAGLVSAGRHDGVVTLSVPTPDPFGADNEYFLGMFVDADGDVSEANEANNHSQGQDLDLNSVEYTVGPLDHFEWDLVASPQARTVPFSAQVRATDSYGWTITTYNDTVDFSGWTDQETSSTVVITECNPDSPDYIEIQNVSGASVDTAGWMVALNDAANGDINAVHSVTWSLPGFMAADEIMYRTDSSSDNYWGSNIWWVDRGWAMIVDDGGDVVDFVAWGYTSSEIAGMSVDVNAHTVTVGSEWSGDGVAFAGSSSLSLQRTSSTDNNGASDLSWVARSKGIQNDGLTVPFASPVSIVPDSATFVAGVWTGDVTVFDVGADMHLRADDGSGHSGITNTFDVVPGPADFDFGDAPDPGYPTLLASDGARHYPAGPTLGSVRDWENDGVPSVDADGDDASGTLDDEDGVTAAPLLAPGIVNTTLTVEASAESFLNAWIDFNADGDWDDPGEQVAVDTPLNAGSNGLSLNVPLSAAAGLTYARLRLTSYDTGGTLQPTGPADDGEVEDYAWTIENYLDLSGSDGVDDVITLWVGTPGGSYHQVEINGTVNHYDAAVYNVIRIDALGGNDTITVHGTNQNESVTLQPGSVDVVGQTYRLEATGVENVTVDAGTGRDQVTMIGSAGSNRLYSYADYARLSDSPRTFSYQVDGFDGICVEAPGTGRDYAFLYDSPGNDELDAEPDEVVFRRAVGTANETVTTAAGFQRVYTYATEGDDTATLTGDDATRNRFYGYADYSILTDSRRAFYFYARGFSTVEAVSPGDGTTYAYLHDSAGVDRFEASPDSATMDRADGWSDTTATGFARVYGYSTRGGEDTAALTGNADGGNQYRGYPSYSTLTDRARSFYHYARGFHSVEATGSVSDTTGDRAFLYDSSGDDVFAAAFEEGGEYQGGVLTDAGGTYESWVKYFDLVYARSSDSGTSDAIDVVEELLAYELIRMGTW